MDLTAYRIIVQNEETKSGIPASEGIMQKIGSAVNFQSERSLYQVSWQTNGFVGNFGSPQNRVDDTRHVIWDYLIVGVYCSVGTAGTSGNLTFDITRKSVSNVTTSIFSTNPVINYASGNGSRIIKRFTDNTNLYISSFATSPVLLNGLLYAGDELQFNILTVQESCLDVALTLDLRPR